MPRPRKPRRVSAPPACERFGPLDGSGRTLLVMAVEEYECVRLIDLEGLTQEACAQRMAVARTTVQAIYASARRKLAQCLVERKELLVAGGGEGRAAPKQREANAMKIAVPYDNGQIFQHFGRTEAFKLYTVQDGAVTQSQVVETGGTGHGALAGLLARLGVDTLLCGGAGAGAIQALSAQGIRVCGGVQGSADEAVKRLLDGTLSFDARATCDHHDHHEHGQACGHGGCGHGC